MKEADIIDALRLSVEQNQNEVLLPIGDDGSVIKLDSNKQMVTVTDAITVDVHYPLGIESHAIGYRCLAVNLSDMAAMGAIPRWASLVFSIPKIDPDWIKGFINGFSEIANQYKISLIGGDTIRGPEFFAVSLQGYSKNGKYVRRRGAKAGDLIYVSGYLGSAAYGLELIKNNNRSAPNNFIDAFLYPEPRVKEGIMLSKYASSMIDISDGFYQDLQRITKRQDLGFDIDVSLLPIEPNLEKVLGYKKAVNLAMNGGDDYELCCTVPKEKEKQFLKEVKSSNLSHFSCIGEIIEKDSNIRDNGSKFVFEKNLFEQF